MSAAAFYILENVIRAGVREQVGDIALTSGHVPGALIGGIRKYRETSGRKAGSRFCLLVSNYHFIKQACSFCFLVKKCGDELTPFSPAKRILLEIIGINDHLEASLKQLRMGVVFRKPTGGSHDQIRVEIHQAFHVDDCSAANLGNRASLEPGLHIRIVDVGA